MEIVLDVKSKFVVWWFAADQKSVVRRLTTFYAVSAYLSDVSISILMRAVLLFIGICDLVFVLSTKSITRKISSLISGTKCIPYCGTMKVWGETSVSNNTMFIYQCELPKKLIVSFFLVSGQRHRKGKYIRHLSHLHIDKYGQNISCSDIANDSVLSFG